MREGGGGRKRNMRGRRGEGERRESERGRQRKGDDIDGKEGEKERKFYVLGLRLFPCSQVQVPLSGEASVG